MSPCINEATSSWGTTKARGDSVTTSYLALRSLLNNKASLQAMFTFNEWMTSKYSESVDGMRIKQTVLSNSFWEWSADMVNALEPLHMVLRMIDYEKFPWIGFLYPKTRDAKQQIIDVMTIRKHLLTFRSLRIDRTTNGQAVYLSEVFI